MSRLYSQNVVNRRGIAPWALAFVALLLTPTCASNLFSPKRVANIGQWGIKSHRIDVESSCVFRLNVLQSLRAGSTIEEDEDEAYDEDEDEAYDEEESSSDEEEEEEEEAESEEVEPEVDETESTSVIEYLSLIHI